jgi:hypothetical protein
MNNFQIMLFCSYLLLSLLLFHHNFAISVYRALFKVLFHWHRFLMLLLYMTRNFPIQKDVQDIIFVVIFHYNYSYFIIILLFLCYLAFFKMLFAWHRFLVPIFIRDMEYSYRNMMFYFPTELTFKILLFFVVIVIFQHNYSYFVIICLK